MRPSTNSYFHNTCRLAKYIAYYEKIVRKLEADKVRGVRKATISDFNTRDAHNRVSRIVKGKMAQVKRFVRNVHRR